MADPTNVFAMDDIKFMTGYNVEPVVASETSLEEAIEKYYGSTRSLELRRDMGGGGGRAARAGATPCKDVIDAPGPHHRRHGLGRACPRSTSTRWPTPRPTSSR